MGPGSNSGKPPPTAQNHKAHGRPAFSEKIALTWKSDTQRSPLSAIGASGHVGGSNLNPEENDGGGVMVPLCPYALRPISSRGEKFCVCVGGVPHRSKKWWGKLKKLPFLDLSSDRGQTMIRPLSPRLGSRKFAATDEFMKELKDDADQVRESCWPSVRPPPCRRPRREF
jgi:hypothetical protein